MSDRKHEHVEPREIAGADLPKWMRHNPNHNAIVGATWCILACISGVVIWQLWIYRASVAAQFGWSA